MPDGPGSRGHRSRTPPTGDRSRAPFARSEPRFPLGPVAPVGVRWRALTTRCDPATALGRVPSSQSGRQSLQQVLRAVPALCEAEGVLIGIHVRMVECSARRPTCSFRTTGGAASRTTAGTSPIGLTSKGRRCARQKVRLGRARRLPEVKRDQILCSVV